MRASFALRLTQKVTDYKGTTRHEPCLLQCLPTWQIINVAPGSGHTGTSSTDGLQFLDQICPEPKAPEGLGDFHINVTVGPVVVVEHSARAGNLVIHGCDPACILIQLELAKDYGVRCRRRAKAGARRTE